MPEEWYSWSHSMKELVEGIRNGEQLLADLFHVTHAQLAEVRVRLTRRESVAKQLDACRDAITALVG